MVKTKERIIHEIESLAEDALGVVLKFILSLEKTSSSPLYSEDASWGNFALESGSFDFWLDPVEADYTLEDLKERK